MTIEEYVPLDEANNNYDYYFNELEDDDDTNNNMCCICDPSCVTSIINMILAIFYC